MLQPDAQVLARTEPAQLVLPLPQQVLQVLLQLAF